MTCARRIRTRVLGLALAAALLSPAGAVQAQGTESFQASFRGTFDITFFSGPGLTHELRFRGTGSGSHFASGAIEGYSRLRPVLTRPLCNEIVHDEVTITTASGDRIDLTNEAVDCLEVTLTARVLIHGSGTYSISGGTGAFAGASGSGAVSTEAEVRGLAPGGVAGTFDPLVFAGTIERPG